MAKEPFVGGDYQLPFRLVRKSTAGLDTAWHCVLAFTTKMCTLQGWRFPQGLRINPFDSLLRKIIGLRLDGSSSIGVIVFKHGVVAHQTRHN